MTPRFESWSRPTQPLALALLLALTSSQAAAQAAPDDTTKAAARELAEQGIDAYQAADYANANRKLDKAYRLFATPTLGLWSARARMQLGLWVEAAERYREAQRVSAAVGDSTTQQQAQKDANQELTTLMPRIPAVTIELEGSDEAGVSLSLDGVTSSSELFGVRLPMNPGVHRIVASRGSERAEVEVRLVEKEQKRVVLRLAPVVATAPAPVAEPVPLVAAPAEASDKVAPAAVSGEPIRAAQHSDAAGAPVRPLAIGAMALGGASLAAAGVTALLAQGKCSGGACASTAEQDKYDPLRTVSTVTFWAGAALAAGGFVAFLVAPQQESARSTQAFRWEIGPLGVNVRGTL